MPLPLIERLQAIVGAAYRIGEEIPGGGMSRVFLAYEPALKRDVVVKVLPPDLLTHESLVRFRREIEFTAQLQHPHILPVITTGGEGELLYYVAPFIKGESLRDHLGSSPKLGLQAGGRLVLELLDATAFAHARGVIHRDIKPANVLLSDGHAILADFGIARALANPDDEQVTYSGTVIGTPVYMAPEQPRDEAADLYAVAVLSYEMIAGALPPPQRSPSQLASGLTAAVPREQRTAARAVAHVLARALARDPRRRFASAREFRREFERALGGSRPRHVLRWSGAIVGVALAAVFVARALTRRSEAAAKSAALGRVVVAPLQNFTGVDSLELVGAMAGDWITEGLQKTGILEVVPTTSAIQAFRVAANEPGASKALLSPRVLASETGATTVVYGALYRVRDRLEFRITVADQRGTRVVGSVTNVSAPLSDPISGVEELRTRVMGWLASQYDERLNAFATRAVRPPTYDAYLAYSDAMNKYVAIDFERALPLFLRASHLDSSFAVAPLYASISMTNLGQFARADSLLQKLDTRRRDLDEYHRAWLDYRIAFVHGDRGAALNAIRTAARLAPESKASYNLAVVAFQTGHLTEALATIQALPPDRGAMRGFVSYWILYGEILHALGRFEREFDVGVIARREYPDRLDALTPVARSLAATGRVSDLEVAMRSVDQLRADPGRWDLGHLLVEVAEELRAHGNGADAALYFDKARVWLQGRNGLESRLLGVMYSLGRFDSAHELVRTLRRAAPDNVEYLGMNGLLAIRMGQRDAASAIADSLAKRQKSYERGANSLYLARMAALRGEGGIAIARLDDAFAAGRAFDLWLHRDNDLTGVRELPAFQRFLSGSQ